MDAENAERTLDAENYTYCDITSIFNNEKKFSDFKITCLIIYFPKFNKQIISLGRITLCL